MRLASYVDEVPEDLQCPICTEALSQPALLRPCNHVFCRQCIDHWLRVQVDETCPMDRQRVDPTPVDLGDDSLIVRTLDGLVIVCECGWTGRKREHRDSCPIVECGNDGCEWVGRVGDEERLHAETCERRTDQCLFCDRRIPLVDFQVHVDGCLQSADLQEFWPSFRFGMTIDEVFGQMQSTPVVERAWEYWPLAEEVVNYECRYFWKYIPFCGSLFADSDLLFSTHAPISYVCFLFKKQHGLASISIRLLTNPRFDRRGQIATKLRRLAQRYGIIQDPVNRRGYGTERAGCHVWIGENETDPGEFRVEYVDPRAVPDNGRTYMPYNP